MANNPCFVVVHQGVLIWLVQYTFFCNFVVCDLISQVLIYCAIAEFEYQIFPTFLFYVLVYQCDQKYNLSVEIVTGWMFCI